MVERAAAARRAGLDSLFLGCIERLADVKKSLQ
jgi:hypothetical protein